MSDEGTHEEAIQPPPLPGVLLRQAREKKKQSVAQVALALKITETYVRALEADDYSQLPQPAFVRGYFRNYAKLVDLPCEALVNRFDENIARLEKDAPLAKPVKPLKNHSTPSPVHALIFVLVIALGGLSYFLWNNWLKPDVKSDPAVIEQPVNQTSSTEAETAAPADASASTKEANLEQTTPTVTSVSENTVETVIKVNDKAHSAESPVADGVAAETQAVDFATKKLMITFNDKCWVEITDASGDVLVSNVQSAGSIIDLVVLPPVNVRLGNVPAVDEIIFDGQTVDKPQTRSKVASMLLENHHQG